METRTVGGNVIEIDEPKAPERPLFELFVRERQAERRGDAGCSDD